ncbi:hypothetical protein, partial [Agrobacterium pusense]|uniref:hypothetical protein n=1 Tax=Agrobacterium pusense TaxID=648995 RepID=UPI00289B944A
RIDPAREDRGCRLKPLPNPHIWSENMSDIIATGFNAGSDNGEISPSSPTAKLMYFPNTDVW